MNPVFFSSPLSITSFYSRSMHCLIDNPSSGPSSVLCPPSLMMAISIMVMPWKNPETYLISFSDCLNMVGSFRFFSVLPLPLSSYCNKPQTSLTQFCSSLNHASAQSCYYSLWKEGGYHCCSVPCTSHERVCIIYYCCFFKHN